MRKTILPLVALCLFMLLVVTESKAQPASFKWPAVGADNQMEQDGPCNDFGSVGLMKLWYYCLYGSRPPISYAHPYSQCGGANAGAGSNIQSTLAFFQTYGGVDSRTLPWILNAACHMTGDPDPYFLDEMVEGSTTTLVGGDCGTPYVSCVSGDGLPSTRYKIAGFTQLSTSISTYTATQWKLALMNYGPIVLNMTDPNLHGQTSHAYVLYGWDSTGNWLLTDSWSTGYTTGLNHTTDNISPLINSNAAYYLTNSASNPSVWMEDYTYNATTKTYSWLQDQGTTVSTANVCVYPACSNAFTFGSKPATITTAGNSVSVNGTTVLTNATVSWSFESTANNGYVSFSPATGLTTTATAARTGSGNIVASIVRPNGICEKIKYAVNVIGTNIPFTLNQTENLCSGRTRVIQYTATSSYPLTCSWTLHPPGGGGVFTTTNGCTFTMDFSTTPSSYGITMSVTSSALPGASDGATTGGPAMSCNGSAVERDSLSSSNSALTFGDVSNITSPEVVPNPASGIVTLRLPMFRAYEVKLFTTQGAVIFGAHSATAAVKIDVSRLASGVYIIQTRDVQTGEISVKKVLVQN